MGEAERVPPGVDASKPSPARMYEAADSDGSRVFYAAVARKPEAER